MIAVKEFEPRKLKIGEAIKLIKNAEQYAIGKQVRRVVFSDTPLIEEWLLVMLILRLKKNLLKIFINTIKKMSWFPKFLKNILNFILLDPNCVYIGI